MLNREGDSNTIVGLFFDGATNYFEELCSPNNELELKKIYEYLNKIRGVNNTQKSFFNYRINKNNKKLWLNKLFYKFAAFFK